MTTQSRSEPEMIGLVSRHRCPTRAQVVAWLERNGWRKGALRQPDFGGPVQTYYYQPIHDADEGVGWEVGIDDDERRQAWRWTAAQLIGEIADMLASRAGDSPLGDPGAVCEAMLKGCEP